MSDASTLFGLNQEVSLSAGHDRMIVVARRVSGGLAHVDEVDDGKACNCFCLAWPSSPARAMFLAIDSSILKATTWHPHLLAAMQEHGMSL